VCVCVCVGGGGGRGGNHQTSDSATQEMVLTAALPTFLYNV
jgi:hypothetical protein